MTIDCVVMFLTSSGTEQYLYTNISKHGVGESTPSMDVLQEIILMIYHIKVISWDIKPLHYLFSTGNRITILLSTDKIMFGLMNIMLVSAYKRSILRVL